LLSCLQLLSFVFFSSSSFYSYSLPTSIFSPPFRLPLLQLFVSYPFTFLSPSLIYIFVYFALLPYSLYLPTPLLGFLRFLLSPSSWPPPSFPSSFTFYISFSSFLFQP
jgi:hypothetical protein